MQQTKEEIVEGFRRQEIQRATRRVLARRGLAGATMQAIADEAGLAKGTLYLYFEDRDTLLEHAADGAFSELLSRLEAIPGQGRPLAETLRALIAAKVAFFEENQDFLRAYIELSTSCAPEDPKRRRPQYQRYLQVLGGVFEAAMRRGEIKAMDPERVAVLVAEGVSAILRRRLDEHPPRPAGDDVDWIVELLLHGLTEERRTT
jgi:TetR/AcrR family fatty acid metabolism transcriptional regulator